MEPWGSSAASFGATDTVHSPGMATSSRSCVASAARASHPVRLARAEFTPPAGENATSPGSMAEPDGSRMRTATFLRVCATAGHRHRPQTGSKHRRETRVPAPSSSCSWTQVPQWTARVAATVGIEPARWHRPGRETVARAANRSEGAVLGGGSKRRVRCTGRAQSCRHVRLCLGADVPKTPHRQSSSGPGRSGARSMQTRSPWGAPRRSPQSHPRSIGPETKPAAVLRSWQKTTASISTHSHSPSSGMRGLAWVHTDASQRKPPAVSAPVLANPSVAHSAAPPALGVEGVRAARGEARGRRPPRSRCRPRRLPSRRGRSRRRRRAHRDLRERAQPATTRCRRGRSAGGTPSPLPRSASGMRRSRISFIAAKGTGLGASLWQRGGIALSS